MWKTIYSSLNLGNEFPIFKLATFYRVGKIVLIVQFSEIGENRHCVQAPEIVNASTIGKRKKQRSYLSACIELVAVAPHRNEYIMDYVHCIIMGACSF